MERNENGMKVRFEAFSKLSNAKKMRQTRFFHAVSNSLRCYAFRDIVDTCKFDVYDDYDG